MVACARQLLRAQIINKFLSRMEAVCPLKVCKMGCNEHLIGKPNCHADHQRDTMCGEGLTGHSDVLPKTEPAAGGREILWWPCEGTS